ncbi:uncharacterized protein BDR25DRAFT_244746 [Lindgomyces ingoldianus]|uniref:Uncharacterized protein n=1 Tax=Lindgomyces ingoldianus TaxID=673940 RepID=A0ACB6QBB0_9PLEO|nr:uncharacterized protein BDR25DRAFT_244746 [Lindgomyces ingoldianus]KAF2463780.1 hypothetical protein BDR25DRAFT_244746 [Lindgomyces ingoldianus]
MATPQPGLQIGPLASTVEVVGFIALTGAAWFNGAELLWTIFLSFQRWRGRYFSCLVIASLGVLVYQSNVFLMIFGTNVNYYGVIASINIGWAAMVTGQSLVLWSRLHLVCRSQVKLRLILYMIIGNAVCLHIPQTAFSLAIKNGVLDPTYKPFELMEKISIALFTAQELIVSSVYLMETVRILRVGELVQKRSNRRKIQLLFLANVAIICIDVITITLEFLAFWGVWCSFKGFGYSVKLKIEFAILNQLRDSVKQSTSSSRYGQASGQSISLSSYGRSRKGSKPSAVVLERQKFEEIDDQDLDKIVKTTEYSVRHDNHATTAHSFALPIQSTTPGADRGGEPHRMPSKSSSEVEFASKGL